MEEEKINIELVGIEIGGSSRKEQPNEEFFSEMLREQPNRKAIARSLYFKSPEHKSRFLAAVQSIGKVYDDEHGKIDPEYGAALYILTADLSTWNKAKGYVRRDGIDFEGLLANVDFSGGYGVLIKWAANMFNESAHIDMQALLQLDEFKLRGAILTQLPSPLELMRLDEPNFRVAIAALLLRRYGLRLSDFA